jgi:hypothetical protein
MTKRHISAKRAWAQLSERAERGEKLGFIAALQLLFQCGMISRPQMIEKLNEARITRDDLAIFHKHAQKVTA